MVSHGGDLCHTKFIYKTFHNKISPVSSSISSHRNEHKVTWETNIVLVFPHEWTSIFCNGAASVLLPFTVWQGHRSHICSTTTRFVAKTPQASNICWLPQSPKHYIFKDHQVLRVAKESCHVKAIKSADRFAILWSYKVIRLKYNQSCKIHSNSQLGSLP